MDQYQQGRHDERQRTMQLIGAVRMDAQTGASGDVLDKLVMSIASEPLEDLRTAPAVQPVSGDVKENNNA